MVMKAYARAKHLEVGDKIMPGALAQDYVEDADYRNILFGAQELREDLVITEIEGDDEYFTITFDTSKYSVMLDFDPYSLVELNL